MLLETLDIKKDDVIIFSRNIFDLERNFKIIFKDDPSKEARKISYGEVCRYINEYTPKNLIVYRLLTNIKDFEIYPSKYGFFLNIGGISELIFFDPVFAVKELEDYSEALNYYDLRFRIQQVGLTTLNRKGDLPNFAEIYSIDLEATEAKFQNDKAFVDAILAFDTPGESTVKKQQLKDKKDSGRAEKAAGGRKKTAEGKKKSSAEIELKAQESGVISPVNIDADSAHQESVRIIEHKLEEDKDFDYKQIMKINFRGTAGAAKIPPGELPKEPENATEKIIDDEDIHPKLIVPKPEGKSAFGRFLLEKQEQAEEGPEEKEDENQSRLVSIFKSPSSLNKFLNGRDSKQVVLKLDKKSSH